MKRVTISRLPVAIAAIFASMTLGCTSRDAAVRPAPPTEQPASQKEAAFVPEVPAPTAETWLVPPSATSRPPFPYLPGEDPTASRSVGSVTHGWLVNASRIPQPHPHLAVLPVQWKRDLDYTSDEMLDLVKAGAAHVAKAHPGSVLWLGNFSSDGGGDIPHSVSHNSGRDADLAFYLLDDEGKATSMDDLAPFDDDGKFTAADGTTYTFDVPRNWKLIEGLVKNGRGTIQYIFISDGLKKLLMNHARSQGVSGRLIRDVGAVLGQPGGALPHNDHFHVRIYCSERDVASGCTDRGRKVSGYSSHAGAKRRAVKSAEDALISEEPDLRVAGARRLALLGASGSASKLAELVDDPESRVRAAAARALADLGKQESVLIARVAQEKDPETKAEIVWALGDFSTKTSTEALTELLGSPIEVALDNGASMDVRVLVADVLASAEDERPVESLIELTKSEDEQVRSRAHRALTMLTNHAPQPAASLSEAWEAWWKEHGRKSRDQWLLSGFKASGFAIGELTLRYVWELTKPILAADHLSYNAQRVLMRLSGRTPASLDWPKNDANFYWRRWFERRWKRLGAPRIPAGMSTLD